MIRRREFFGLLGGAAVWPLTARAQQTAVPMIGFMNGSAADPAQETAFRKGLSETGYTDGQNVRVEFHWLEGQYERVPAAVAVHVS